MLEKQLIRHCSPTLAGLKSASLFSMIFADEKEKTSAQRDFECKFSEKGLSLKCLGEKNGRTLVYVFRRKMLVNELTIKERSDFIAGYEYDTSSLTKCFSRLEQRIAAEKHFPHEIGLFLGYPLADVEGFIKNKGQNYCFSGYWKVYANENNTKKLFEKYDHCSRAYAKLFENGSPIESLAVKYQS